MKKYYPYVFPALALLVVGVLTFRWYNMRTQRDGQITSFGEGVEIENLSEGDADRILRGVGDYKTSDLIGEGENQGQVRYEIKNDKVNFSVVADLPELKEGNYQVWLQDPEGVSKSKAFVLEIGKGGHMGSGALDAEKMPFEVVVSVEKVDDAEMENVVLKGMVK